MGEAGAGRQTAGSRWDGTQPHRREGAADAEEGTQRGARRARAEPAGAEATAQTSGTWLPVTQRLAAGGRADLGKPAVHVLQGDGERPWEVGGLGRGDKHGTQTTGGQGGG